MRALWRELAAMRVEAIRRFVAWADDVKRRGDAGEWGKWPWQEGYDKVGLWGKKPSEKPDEESR